MDPALLALEQRSFENAYHVGYLVPDLVEAMDVVGRRLQISWATPFEMDGDFTTGRGERDCNPVRIAYSAQGPPYLELIEVVDVDGSIFSDPVGGGFHHVGIFAHRWRDEVARLVGGGMEVERWGPGVAFVRDPQLGLRIEVVSFKGRDFLLRILNGELGAEHPLMPNGSA